MTPFDQAFIKAFSPSGPLPDPSHGERTRPPHVVPAVGPAQAPPEPAPAAQPSSLGGLKLDTKPAPAHRPLSSFAARPKVHDSCRALLEVDHLQWPQACEELLERGGKQWDGLVELVIQRLGEGHKCVALASSERGDGRTTTVLALARQLAGRGLRPVVVDVDGRNPQLVRTCGVSVHTGWDDLIASELPLGEALITAVEDGVTLMPWRSGEMSLSELAPSLRTAQIFGSLREHYDVLLLDTIPLMGQTAIADFARFATAVHLDALYLIHNVRTTSREQFASTCAKLRRAGVPLGGMIENFVSSTRGDESAAGTAPLASGGRIVAVHS